MLIEVLLELLVGIIDAKLTEKRSDQGERDRDRDRDREGGERMSDLLEAIDIKDLETKDI
jgi:hypothetical protein